MKGRSFTSCIIACVFCIAVIPAGTACADDEVHIFVDEADAYLALFFLAVAVVTSPMWLPVNLTEESATMYLETNFHRYPYKDNAEGFISFDKGSRSMVAFVDIAGSVGGNETGRSVEATLLTNKRIGLHYNQAYYQDDDLPVPQRGASSLHAMYMFARDEHWAFSIGVGGRYEHRPMKDTTLSGIYHIDWFPAKPIRLSGTYEYDGESHFRIGCSVMMQNVGFGVALRSEVIDDERYQAPEIFVAILF